MGLTIHFDFKFKGNEDEAKAKIEEVKRIAENLPFEEVGPVWELDYFKDFNDDAETKKQAPKDPESYRWAKIQYEPRNRYEGEKYIPESEPQKFRGFVVMCWAGSGCEATNIGLISKDNKSWVGSAFTKTQYAKHFVKAHLLVITILDVCKKLGILKEVSDEGDYWETRDLNKLGENINASTAMIAGLGKALKKAWGTDKVESAIDKSKNYMKVKNGPDRKRRSSKKQTPRDNRRVR